MGQRSVAFDDTSNKLIYGHSGKRHGRGEYLYSDGTKYIGQWDNDRIHGEGTSWYPNGNKYEKVFFFVLLL